MKTNRVGYTCHGASCLWAHCLQGVSHPFVLVTLVDPSTYLCPGKRGMDGEGWHVHFLWSPLLALLAQGWTHHKHGAETWEWTNSSDQFHKWRQKVLFGCLTSQIPAWRELPPRKAFPPSSSWKKVKQKLRVWDPTRKGEGHGPYPRVGQVHLSYYIIHSSSKLSWASIGFQPYTRDWGCSDESPGPCLIGHSERQTDRQTDRRMGLRRECMKCCSYCHQDTWFDKRLFPQIFILFIIAIYWVLAVCPELC